MALRDIFARKSTSGDGSAAVAGGGVGVSVGERVAAIRAGFPAWLSKRREQIGSGGGVKPSNLQFGTTNNAELDSILERLGMAELMGAAPEDNADLKANHVMPGILDEMLGDTMTRIEERFHSGVYDAAVMPLVEEYIQEMQNLAQLQARRMEIVSRRVADVKEANEKAFAAVSAARAERAQAIVDSYQKAQEWRRQMEESKKSSTRFDRLKEAAMRKHDSEEAIAIREAKHAQKVLQLQVENEQMLLDARRIRMEGLARESEQANQFLMQLADSAAQVREINQRLADLMSEQETFQALADELAAETKAYEAAQGEDAGDDAAQIEDIESVNDAEPEQSQNRI